MNINIISMLHIVDTRTPAIRQSANTQNLKSSILRETIKILSCTCIDADVHAAAGCISYLWSRMSIALKVAPSMDPDRKDAMLHV